MFTRSELVSQLRYALLRIKEFKRQDYRTLFSLSESDIDLIEELLQQWYNSFLED